MTSDSQNRNYYADHLAEVNKSNSVKAIEDIRNEKGAIIVPKGAEITQEMSNKIARFKLSTPLESSINLEKVITPKLLHQKITEINKRLNLEPKALDLFKPKLVRHCQLYGNHPLLAQKLTVLAERLPEVYNNTMITSNLALHIAHQLDLDEETTHSVFVATQMHDTGLLNIAPEIVHKKGKYEPSEWKLLQGHSTIGRVILEMIPGLPKKAATAIFEHHERLDGTGYPVGKSENELSVEGQIIAISDTVNAILSKRLLPSGYQVKDLIPVIQMNSHVYPKSVHDALLRFLSLSQFKPTRVMDDNKIETLIKFLLVLQKILLHWFKLAMKFTLKLREHPKTQKITNVVLVVERINQTINQSGLFSEGMTEWLNHVLETKDSKEYQEVEYTGLMFDEFRYHLQQLHKLMHIAVEGVNEELEKECHGIGLLLKDIPNKV
ncbi:MAG: HD-GYP domain-containing protein [Oleiphilus sp.]